MLRGLLIFGAGIVVGAVGASYLAGVNEGRRQALEDWDDVDAERDDKPTNTDEATVNPV